MATGSTRPASAFVRHLASRSNEKPFLLMLLCEREIRSHWFKTGSPKFLIDTLMNRGAPTLPLGKLHRLVACLFTAIMAETCIHRWSLPTASVSRVVGSGGLASVQRAGDERG